jgi:hypothetical protein
MVCLTRIDTGVVDDEGLKQLLSVLVGSTKSNLTDCTGKMMLLKCVPRSL